LKYVIHAAFYFAAKRFESGVLLDY